MTLDSLLARLEGRSVTPVTLDDNMAVTSETTETDYCTLVTSVTPDNPYINFFEERAGIAEFDGCQSQIEAELIAYKDTLSEWAYNNPLVGYEITNCAYCGEDIDFSAGGYIAWGAVYCCYTSQDNEHLRPYLQSRIQEAKTYLKSIGIKQPIPS